MLVSKDECKKFKTIDDITTLCIIFIFSTLGLRFIVTSPTKIISIYNEHLFTQYKEQANLNIFNTIEIAKHYFT